MLLLYFAVENIIKMFFKNHTDIVGQTIENAFESISIFFLHRKSVIIDSAIIDIPLTIK